MRHIRIHLICSFNGEREGTQSDSHGDCLQLVINRTQPHLHQATHELAIADLEHLRKRHPETALRQQAMPGLDLPLQAEGEVLREVLELREVSAHVMEKELDFGLEIVLDTEGEHTGRAEHHAACLQVGEAESAEVVKLGEESGFYAGDKQEGGAAGDAAAADEAEAAEKAEGGEELGGDAGDKESGAASDGLAEVRERDGGGTK